MRLLLPLFTVVFAAGADSSVVYGIKAGYLFNFLRFAEWPESVLPPRQPLRIAIAADDTTFQLIASKLAGKSVNDHPITVERFEAKPDAPRPHLFFLTASATPADRAAVSAFAQAPVLTIGETERFAAREGILNFVLVDEAVRFEVNLAAAQRAGLGISSRLSKVAIVVRPDSAP